MIGDIEGENFGDRIEVWKEEGALDQEFVQPCCYVPQAGSFIRSGVFASGGFYIFQIPIKNDVFNPFSTGVSYDGTPFFISMG